MENLVREIFGKIDKPELGDNPFENIDGSERKTDNSTKLDLARAYLDMGDEEGAVDVLMEVIDEGNITQQREARELLTNITTE